MKDRKVALSTAWIFVMFNFLYADVVALFDYTFNGKGNAGSLQFTPVTLVGVALLLEIPMLMIILSRVLKYGANRWTNIVIGIVYTLVTLVTQFIIPIKNGNPVGYYIFFGTIETVATLFIVWYAWKWPKPEVGP